MSWEVIFILLSPKRNECNILMITKYRIIYNYFDEDDTMMSN